MMIKPASSLCDMRCKYCFYADVADARAVRSFGMMSDTTTDAMLKSIASELNVGDAVSFAFQGGEPTLAGLAFFRRFVEKTETWKDVRVSYALQTNGLLLDDVWCAFLKEHRFLVGLSLDLLPEAHDGARVDARGEGTYRRVVGTMEQLRRYGVDFNVLCTLTSDVARHPKQVWNQLVKLEIDYVQFTPCLGALDGQSSSPYALTPQRFASFYTQLFGLWYADYQKGKRRSVKLFDDIVNQLVLGRPTGCGMDGVCRPQLVIEADGSAYPCDFYCLDEYRMGNITSDSIETLLHSDGAKAFLSRPHTAPRACASCRFARFCGGNCRRMQREICASVTDESCGYSAFLEQCGKPLARLAEQVKSTYLRNQR
ncbi:MAG: SPASM domain-containing protein [Clostridia bacterium]|nr:SPASM domain-containing protein [Clostridia bacterium]